jgi:alkaline phosphatase
MKTSRGIFPPSRRPLAALVTGLVVATTGVGAFAVSVLAEHGGAARLDGDQSSSVKDAVDGGRADNVILLIGDGMGDSEITSARNYEHGAGGRFAGIDALPLTGQYTTYSLTKDGKPDYVPDSAATGTAWATGTKTYDNAVSVDIGGKAQRSLLELAKKKGYKTGDVTTSELQDATPAVQVAHISSRSCYGPVKTTSTCPEAALENGGPGSITEQLLTTRPDVTLGGGATTFDEKAVAGQYKGLTLLDQAERRGYQLVSDLGSLNGITKANQKSPLLGLFGPGNLPVRWTGPAATSNGGAQAPARCQENADRPASQPSLARMTSKAIALLDQGDQKGFFLQVEGASIDKRDHAADACGQIGETVDLDEAVQVALKFAKKDKHTTVLVTADHAHTSQIVEAGSTTPGLSVNLLTNEGSPMTMSYGTAPLGGSQQHTGSQLRIAGYGPQAANAVGLTDQTDLFFTIARALGLDNGL